MKKILGGAIVLLLLVGLFLFWRSTRGPQPSADSASAPAGASAAPSSGELGRCDSQPRAPQLPATLSPTSTDIAAIVTALDAALNDQHKAWLRCFTLDDELMANTHHSLGRWLRTTLRLRQPAALQALGAKSPDEASSIIVLVYAAHLRGQQLSVTDAKTRRTEALAAAGVTP